MVRLKTVTRSSSFVVEIGAFLRKPPLNNRLVQSQPISLLIAAAPFVRTATPSATGTLWHFNSTVSSTVQLSLLIFSVPPSARVDAFRAPSDVLILFHFQASHSLMDKRRAVHARREVQGMHRERRPMCVFPLQVCRVLFKTRLCVHSPQSVEREGRGPRCGEWKAGFQERPSDQS